VLLINQKGASIGRMTVYRTLDLLSELGLVRPVYQGTGAAHYVLLQNGHHHHLICISCDRVIEIDRCLLPEIEHGIAEYLSFEIRGHLLEVYGQCDQCQKGTRSLV
jgi:Fur family ferric uptake transcriptional regulator